MLCSKKKKYITKAIKDSSRLLELNCNLRLPFLIQSTQCLQLLLFSNVSKPAPLIFTVTDGDDSLGAVSLPLAQIPSVAHRRRWMPLTAKNAQANGDLCVDCWVLSFKKATSTNDGVKWNNLLTFGLKTGSKERSKRRASVEAASISMKGSRSIENLYTSSTLQPPVAEEGNHPLKSAGSTSKLSPESSPTTSSARLEPFPLFKPRLAPTLGQVLSSSNAPEITGISPKSGPSSGGTRITVRGCNLGKSKDDIIYIGVSGCDLLQTLEYHSPAKLVVVSKPWIGSGPIVLETKSGGRGISTLVYKFQDRPLGENKCLINCGGLPCGAWDLYAQIFLRLHLVRCMSTSKSVTKCPVIVLVNFTITDLRQQIQTIKGHNILLTVLKYTDTIQLSPEGEVNSGGYMYRDARRRDRYIHRPSLSLRG